MEVTDTTDISNNFNAYFSTIGEKLVNKLNSDGNSNDNNKFKIFCDIG